MSIAIIGAIDATPSVSKIETIKETPTIKKKSFFSFLFIIFNIFFVVLINMIYMTKLSYIIYCMNHANKKATITLKSVDAFVRIII